MEQPVDVVNDRKGSNGQLDAAKCRKLYLKTRVMLNKLTDLEINQYQSRYVPPHTPQRPILERNCKTSRAFCGQKRCFDETGEESPPMACEKKSYPNGSKGSEAADPFEGSSSGLGSSSGNKILNANEKATAASSSNTNSQRQDSSSRSELPPITYNSMQFDFPKIKVEPPEWESVDENQFIMNKEFLVVDGSHTPMEITLDDDNDGGSLHSSSLPSVTLALEQSGTRNVDVDPTTGGEVTNDTSQSTLVTSINKAAANPNLEMRSEAKAPLISIPTSKIRVNIEGLETRAPSLSPGHSGSRQEEKKLPPRPQQQQQQTSSSKSNNDEPSSTKSVIDNKSSSSSPSGIDDDGNSCNQGQELEIEFITIIIIMLLNILICIWYSYFYFLFI